MAAMRLSFLSMAIGVAAATAASPAAACVIIPITCVGGAKSCPPSPAQKRRWSGELTIQRAAEARKRLAAGTVDVAAEFAELLVPNVRPISILRSDCGIEGEIDYAEGEETEEAFLQAVVAGSLLEGSTSDRFEGLLRKARSDFSFGKACNTEFRSHFADYLRREVMPADLKEAWLFLEPRNHSRYPRLMRFAGTTRMPPVQWTFADVWLSGQADRALKRRQWGPSLTTAMDRFWAEERSRLGDDSIVCPSAVAEWARVRRAVLQQMLERVARQRHAGSSGS
jgi:hypothetical protein